MCCTLFVNDACRYKEDISEFGDLYQDVADAYLEMGKASMALSLYERLYEIKHDEQKILDNIAKCHSLLGRHADAFEKYKLSMENQMQNGDNVDPKTVLDLLIVSRELQRHSLGLRMAQRFFSKLFEPRVRQWMSDSKNRTQKKDVSDDEGDSEDEDEDDTIIDNAMRIRIMVQLAFLYQSLGESYVDSLLELGIPLLVEVLHK